MNWISIDEEMPSTSGIYLVKRQWNDIVIATSECYFDGMFWQPEIMEMLAGPITHWTTLPNSFNQL